uniref:Uncharacterized protein n=1 Tax=Guillardia theta TaxID=55529 RepID=A0A7S4KMR3_GUITH|mmetsp:Transcript_27486/g.89548  ORF Transcript_27486/g.89548 Transcript_27486/m.89548 type:complete len:448 (+) Transcript_27486:119-1462(+)
MTFTSFGLILLLLMCLGSLLPLQCHNVHDGSLSKLLEENCSCRFQCLRGGEEESASTTKSTRQYVRVNRKQRQKKTIQEHEETAEEGEQAVFPSANPAQSNTFTGRSSVDIDMETVRNTDSAGYFVSETNSKKLDSLRKAVEGSDSIVNPMSRIDKLSRLVDEGSSTFRALGRKGSQSEHRNDDQETSLFSSIYRSRRSFVSERERELVEAVEEVRRSAPANESMRYSAFKEDPSKPIIQTDEHTREDLDELWTDFQSRLETNLLGKERDSDSSESILKKLRMEHASTEAKMTSNTYNSVSLADSLREFTDNMDGFTWEQNERLKEYLSTKFWTPGFNADVGRMDPRFYTLHTAHVNLTEEQVSLNIQLRQAVQVDDLPRIEETIASGADINLPMPFYKFYEHSEESSEYQEDAGKYDDCLLCMVWPPLHWAAAMGSVPTLLKLVNI